MIFARFRSRTPKLISKIVSLQWALDSMSMRFLIRRAVESDVDSAHKLIAALGYPDIRRAEFEKVFQQVLQHPDTLVYLAEDAGGRALGLMTLSHRPQLRLAGEILCLDELAVIEEARGTGIGSALLEEARRVARELNAARLELHTNRARESYSRKFYIKNGFTEANSALLRMQREDLN